MEKGFGPPLCIQLFLPDFFREKNVVRHVFEKYASLFQQRDYFWGL